MTPTLALLAAPRGGAPRLARQSRFQRSLGPL